MASRQLTLARHCFSLPMSGFRNPQSLEYIVFIIGCSAPFPIFDECHQAERRARENGSQHKDSWPVQARNKSIVMPVRSQ